MSDGLAFVDVSWDVAVDLTPSPLQIQASVSEPVVYVGQETVLTVNTTGGIGAVSLDVTLDGSPVALDDNQQFVIVATSVGRHDIEITASTPSESTSEALFYSAADLNDITPPVVYLSSPMPGAEITSPADVIGTVQDGKSI